MSNKKEINLNSGKRLKELIKELNMTQQEFGERIGLCSRQISCIVTGTRRLTEENARRIAQLFPRVRYEWLMGYDDYKDDYAVKIAKFFKEEYRIRKTELDFWPKEAKVIEILNTMGYCVKSIYPRKIGIEEQENNYDDLELVGRKLFSYLMDKSIEPEFIMEHFSKNEIEIFLAEMRRIGIGFEQDDESNSKLTDELYDELLSDAVKYAEMWENDKDRLLYSVKYCICDMDNNIIAEMTGKEYEIFVNEVHDVTNALIKYRVTQKEEQQWQTSRNDETKPEN